MTLSSFSVVVNKISRTIVKAVFVSTRAPASIRAVQTVSTIFPMWLPASMKR